MKARSIGGLVVGLVASLALGGNPAGAGTALGPEIVDVAGDANFINSQGNFDDIHVPTPVSIAGADIRAIWFETTYDAVKDIDELGNVLAVRFVPTALLMKIQTEAPPRPTFGPTLLYRVQTKIAQCNATFEAIVRGPQSLPTDPAETARINKNSSACPGGSGVIAHPTFSLSSEGNVLVLRYPLSALPYSSTQLVLAPDVVVRPRPAPIIATVLGNQIPDPSQPIPSVRTWFSLVAASLTAPSIDETMPLGMQFRIGQDVPDNIDCFANPERAECVA